MIIAFFLFFTTKTQRTQRNDISRLSLCVLCVFVVKLPGYLIKYLFIDENDYSIFFIFHHKDTEKHREMIFQGYLSVSFVSLW